MRVKQRAWAVVAVVIVAAGVLGACGSNDNGGVIEGPSGTTVAPATTTAGNNSSPGY